MGIEILNEKDLGLDTDKILVLTKGVGLKTKVPFGRKVEGKAKMNEYEIIRQLNKYVKKYNISQIEKKWCLELNLKDSLYYVFDVDNNDTYDDVLKVYPFLQDTIYLKGNTKGFHFYLIIHNAPDYTNEVRLGLDEMKDIDLLKNKVVWEDLQKEVFGTKIKELEWNDIKQYFNVNKMLGDKKKEKTKKTDFKYDVDDEFLKGLLMKCIDYTRAENVDEWRTIGACIYNYKKEKGLEYFLDFSKKSTIHIQNDDLIEENKKTYLNVCSKYKEFTIATIIHYAKIDNMEQFKKEQFKKLKGIIIEPIDFGPLEWGDYFKNEHYSTMRYCLKKWYICYDNLWKEVECPTNMCVKIAKDLLNTSIARRQREFGFSTDDKEKEVLAEIIGDFRRQRNQVDTPSFNSQLHKHLKVVLKDNTFNEKLYDHKECLIFKNGILNMITKKMTTEIVPESYVPENYIIDWDFKEDKDDKKYKFIKEKLLQIHNNNKEQLDYILRVYGYALSGNMTEQILVNIKGVTAGNGKTTITESLKKIVPTLVEIYPSDILKSDCGKRHKYLWNIWGKRILGFEELPKDKKLDIKFLKDMTDGVLKNEILFGTSQDIPITGTIFSNSNHTPCFGTDVDNGIARRYKELLTKNKFHNKSDYANLKIKTPNDFQAETNIKEKFIDGKNEMIHLIIEGYKDFITKKGLDEPIFVTESSKTTIEVNNIQKILYDESYIETNDDGDLESKRDFCSILKISQREFIDFINIHNIKYNCKKKYKGNKGFLYGIKRIKEDEVESENEEDKKN
jgi:hypothetical protein